MGLFCEEYFLNLNMNEIFFLVEEAIEGGYNARAIGESIFTEGDTLDELRTNIRDAVHCHFDEDKLPKIIRLHLIKEEVITV
jgi:hypothetical protein